MKAGAPKVCERKALRQTEGRSLDVVYALKRDDFTSNRHPALTYSWSMMFSENRFPLFGIML
jgi:hypothetical protein